MIICDKHEINFFPLQAFTTPHTNATVMSNKKAIACINILIRCRHDHYALPCAGAHFARKFDSGQGSCDFFWWRHLWTVPRHWAQLTDGGHHALDEGGLQGCPAARPGSQDGLLLRQAAIRIRAAKLPHRVAEDAVGDHAQRPENVGERNLS